MSQYNARLITEPRIRQVVELTDSLADHCQLIAEALCEYENAVDLSGDERREARAEARDQLWEAWGDLLAVTRQLEAQRDALTTAVTP